MELEGIAKLLMGQHEVIDGSLENPNWHEADRVHDWRNHVPEEIRLVWPSLSMEARAVAFVMAESEADDEEWD